MEYGIPVRLIILMAMFKPVGGMQMNFHVPCPDCVPDPQSGVKKVGAAIGVLLPGMYNYQRVTGFSDQIGIEMPVFP
jgi:hypothetical protein